MNKRSVWGGSPRAVLAMTLLGVSCAWPRGASSPTPAEPREFRVDLASAGDGSPFYRIPALAVSARGTVLAAYDARPTLGDLPSNIAVIVRRSRDNGQSWEAPIAVRRDTAPLGYGDPSFVVDRETQRIFLFYAASVRQEIGRAHV